MLPVDKIKCQGGGEQQSVYHLILGCHLQKDQTSRFFRVTHEKWMSPHCLVDYLWQRPINQSTGGSSWTPRITRVAAGSKLIFYVSGTEASQARLSVDCQTLETVQYGQIIWRFESKIHLSNWASNESLFFCTITLPDCSIFSKTRTIHPSIHPSWRCWI